MHPTGDKSTHACAWESQRGDCRCEGRERGHGVTSSVTEQSRVHTSHGCQRSAQCRFINGQESPRKRSGRHGSRERPDSTRHQGMGPSGRRTMATVMPRVALALPADKKEEGPSPVGSPVLPLSPWCNTRPKTLQIPWHTFLSMICAGLPPRTHQSCSCHQDPCISAQTGPRPLSCKWRSSQLWRTTDGS